MARLGALLMVLMWCAAASGAEEGEAAGAGGGLFTGTLADSLWTVVAFVTLLLVLTKVAWRPLLTALNHRREHIEQQLKTADDSRQRAEQMLEDYKQEGLTLVQRATEQAQQHQQHAAEATRQEVQAIRRRAQEEMESAYNAASQQLWKETGDIILRVSSDVLSRAITAEDNQHLVDEAVQRIQTSGGS